MFVWQLYVTLCTKGALPLLSFSLSAIYVYLLERKLNKLWTAFYTHWDFLSVLELIDGSHIPIITEIFSIVLQAQVDHEYKFMNTYVD